MLDIIASQSQSRKINPVLSSHPPSTSKHHKAPARKMKLATCLLNISEARNQETIRKIIKASQASIEAGGGPIRACVLKVFRDLEYNRSVITIR